MHSTYIHIIYSFNFLISLIVSSKPRNAPYNYAIKNKDTSIYMNVSQVCHMDVTCHMGVSHGCHINVNVFDTSVFQG